MRTATRLAAIAVAAFAVAGLTPAAFAQIGNTTGNSTGGLTGGATGNTTGNVSAGTSTGPGAPLTAGTGGSAPAGGGVDEEPLATTGGGDLAFAAGSLVAAGGLGLRWYVVRRR